MNNAENFKVSKESCYEENIIPAVVVIVNCREAVPCFMVSREHNSSETSTSKSPPKSAHYQPLRPVTKQG